MYLGQKYLTLFLFFSLPALILTHEKLSKRSSHCKYPAKKGVGGGVRVGVGLESEDCDYNENSKINIRNNTNINNSDDEDDNGSDNEKSAEYKYLKSYNWTVHCKFQKNERVCSNKKIERKYFFDLHTRRCDRFEYGHCRDIFNMFSTRIGCKEQCQDDAFFKLDQPKLKPGIFCRFQPDFGDCNSYFPSFYFDITVQRCRGFSYSGCGGNRNRFSDAKECLRVCGTDTVLYLN